MQRSTPWRINESEPAPQSLLLLLLQLGHREAQRRVLQVSKLGVIQVNGLPPRGRGGVGVNDHERVLLQTKINRNLAMVLGLNVNQYLISNISDSVRTTGLA